MAVLRTSRYVRTSTETPDDVYYIVARRVAVRKTPTMRSTLLTELAHGDRVRLIEAKHKWILAEYFDDFAGQAKHGWLPKKYLKRLEPNTQSRSAALDSGGREAETPHLQAETERKEKARQLFERRASAYEQLAK